METGHAQYELRLQAPSEPAYSRHSDPITSVIAAAKVDTSSLEALVMAALESVPDGLTSHQIAERTGQSLVTISPRLRPLVRKGLVRDTERTIEHGRARIRWQAIPANERHKENAHD